MVRVILIATALLLLPTVCLAKEPTIEPTKITIEKGIKQGQQIKAARFKLMNTTSKTAVYTIKTSSHLTTDLKEIKLNAGESGYFKVMIDIPTNGKPGKYTGFVEVVANGERESQVNGEISYTVVNTPPPLAVATYVFSHKDVSAALTIGLILLWARARIKEGIYGRPAEHDNGREVHSS
jgi:hypothetical protein